MKMKRENKAMTNETTLSIRKYLTEAGLTRELKDKFIKDFLRYRRGESSLCASFSLKDLSTLGREEFALRVLKIEKESGSDNLFLGFYLRYLENKNRFAAAYLETESWDNLLTKVLCNCDYGQECFIEYLEETFNVFIKDGEHLQMITGITEVSLTELEETVTSARYSRYYRALLNALSEGKKYKDLLEITPENFGLPKIWSGCLGSDQKSTILWAIYFHYSIPEFSALGMLALPNIRKIAKDLEVPYEVLKF